MIADREEARARSDRSERMLRALEIAVDGRKEAMNEWRAYIKAEEAIHVQILHGLEKINTQLEHMGDDQS